MNEPSFEPLKFYCISVPEYCFILASIADPDEMPPQGTKIIQYCTCPAGRVFYNFHSSSKHIHLSFKSACNKEHMGVIYDMTSSSNSSQSTHPTGRVLWEELIVLSRVGNVSGYRCEADCRSRGRELDPGPVPYFRGD